jgi:cytochrome c-type biogenesis protein CcmE
MQKYILPLLVIAIIGVIYISYFSPTDELGVFASFDKNNNANRDIIVKLAPNKPFERDVANGSTIFYVVDKHNQEMKVVGPANLPPGMNDVKTIVLRGHLHGDYFHAAQVTTR